MKTFAEINGKKLFDWNKFLSKKNHTKAEFEAAKKCSFSWVTCACGNQCSVIPRKDESNSSYPFGMPLDIELARLGCRFNMMIENRNFNGAKVVLQKIEKRSNQIIIDIQKDLLKKLAETGFTFFAEEINPKTDTKYKGCK